MADTEKLEYAAAALHITMQTARRMANRGELKGSFRVPGTQQWLIHRATFDAWVLKLVNAPVSLRRAAAEVPEMAGPIRLEPAFAKMLGAKAVKRLQQGVVSQFEVRRP